MHCYYSHNEYLYICTFTVSHNLWVADIKKENLDSNQSPVFDFPATNQIASPAAVPSPFDPSKLAANSPIITGHNFSANQSQMSWMDQFNQFQQQTANLPAPEMKV